MIPLSDGGFALVGHTLGEEALQEQIYVMTTDSGGNPNQAMSYGGGFMDMGSTLLQQVDGSFLVAGWSHISNETEQNIRLIGVGLDLQAGWAQSFGGSSQERCYSMLQNHDGNIIMAGYTSSFGAGLSDFWLLCADTFGDSLWSRTYGDSELQECYSISETSDGGYLLAGYTGSNSNDDDDFLAVRVDNLGNTIWQRTFGGDEQERCFDCLETSDGGFLLAGRTSSFGAGGKDAWIVRANSAGDSLWSRTFGGTFDDSFQSICLRPDGGFILGGWTDSFAEHNADMWLVRIDANGDLLWDRTYGGRSSASWDECTAVKETPDGGFILAGSTGYAPGEWQDSDFLLIKIGADPMDVEHSPPFLPDGFELQAFPNPFNSVSTIRLTVPFSQNIRLSVYNIQGRMIQEVARGPMNLGTHYLTFVGEALSSGTYFVNLQGEDFSATQKLILLK